MTTKRTIVPMRSLCEACGTAPSELHSDGRRFKRRCSDCQRAYELQCERERAARRKLAREEAAQ